MKKTKVRGVQIAGTVCLLFLLFTFCKKSASVKTNIPNKQNQSFVPGKILSSADTIILDTALYNRKILQLVHNKPSQNWPVNTVCPLNGAVLPFKRIVAYYGNLYSTGMGILGALPPDQMLVAQIPERLVGQ